MLKHFRKEERPSNGGLSPFLTRYPSFLLLIFSLFFSWTVHAMDLFRLKNNLQYIFETRPGSGVVAIQVWVKVGSKNEEPRTAGITHFIEHLIFKGSKNLKGSEMAARIESLGGSINAFTSYENTVYHVVIPARAFEEGFRILADAVRNPLFPEEEIAKEKKVVLEEIKMGEDDPQRKLFKELFLSSYRGHPYGRPIIGFEETVREITRKDIASYCDAHYKPDNMVIVVVGDFLEELAQRLIDETFGPPGPTTAPTRGTAQAAAGEEGPKLIEKDLKETYLAVSFPIPPLIHKDMPALEVLGTILGDGESSRLQEELKRKKGLVTHASTFLFTPREDGLFVFYATFKGREMEPVLDGVRREVARIVEEGVSDWEIEKARNIIKASYIYAAETAQGRARQMGNYHTVTGDPLFIDRFVQAVDNVTGDEVKRVARNYLSQKGKEKVVALLPGKKSNPHTLKLDNRFTCLINKNSASPSFAFRIGFVGGVKEEPKGKNGAFQVLAKMLLRGTAGRDATMIARQIDLLAGDISPFSGKNVFGLSGKFLSKDLQKAMEILRELVSSTVIREEELKKVREEVLSEVRKRDDGPISHAFMQFNRMLYEGHPYAKDPLGTEEEIRGITRDDVEKMYRDYVTPDGAFLALSGEIEEGEVQTLVKNLFSEWKGVPQTLRIERPAPAVRKKVEIERERAQSHVIFGFPGSGLIDEDRYALEVMASILSGMGGRIHRLLREENPLAYALTFFNHMAYEAGGMGVYIGTDRKSIEAAEKIVEAEIGRIQREGFTEKEVEDAKGYLVGNHYIRMQSNGAIVLGMCLDAIYGLGANFFKLWPGRVEKVTRDDVNRVARKYLSADKMVELVVGPRKVRR
jgi:zinc protease